MSEAKRDKTVFSYKIRESDLEDSRSTYVQQRQPQNGFHVRVWMMPFLGALAVAVLAGYVTSVKIASAQEADRLDAVQSASLEPRLIKMEADNLESKMDRQRLSIAVEALNQTNVNLNVTLNKALDSAGKNHDFLIKIGAHLGVEE